MRIHYIHSADNIRRDHLPPGERGALIEAAASCILAQLFAVQYSAFSCLLLSGCGGLGGVPTEVCMDVLDAAYALPLVVKVCVLAIVVLVDVACNCLRGEGQGEGEGGIIAGMSLCTRSLLIVVIDVEGRAGTPVYTLITTMLIISISIRVRREGIAIGHMD